MIEKAVKRVIKYFGYALVESNIETKSLDSDKERMLLFDKVGNYTMTSYQRICSIIDSIEYLIRYNIDGDIVECGVWRGGSMMAAAISLMNNNDDKRDLYLYDTFEGMSDPDERDISVNNVNAKDYLNKNKRSKEDLIWAFSTLNEVKENIMSTNYPEKKIHFIKGKVEDTLEQSNHRKIALLRLDTDWYESTKCELENLFPLLVNGGVLIIDDYGHWKGCKKAVDEYFANNNIRIFLMVIDDTGRIAIKQKND
jgi:O-methyltransferase